MIPRILERILFSLYAICLAVLLVAVGVYFNLRDDLPQLPDSLEKINLSLPTEIYSADGEVIKVLGQRHPVVLDEISPHFTKSIIAVEDSRFYTHNGLDHLGLIRAFWHNLKSMRIREGGSTITQQLSKNLFFSFERKWTRKIKELLVALQMEATFSKDDILEAYCNQVYFGSGAYGVEEGAQTYFGKRAKDLTLLQAAMLAGLPNSPNRGNPFSDFDRAMRRTEYILKRLVKDGYITTREKEEALETDLALVAPRIEKDPNQYFLSFVINKLEKEYGKEFVHFGGLRIFTTIDTEYQFYAHRAVQTQLKSLDRQMPARKDKEHLQAAAVSIENKTGAVRVLIGGRQYSESQFNRAISNNRHPGSSFKPIVYLTAMEDLGLSPATVLNDAPTKFNIPGGDPWEPRNFGDQYMGEVILKKALMNSLNLISAKLVYELTPRRVIETARLMGITSPLGDHLSLALGTSGISPLEMATAYSVIANQGVLNEPYFIQKIEDYRGNALYEHFFYGVQRFSSKAVYPLLDMMQGVIDGGTGRAIRRLGFKHPAGGKTGTSNDYKDAWFNGFTKDLSTSVWVGYDNNDPMVDKSQRGLTGGRASAPIWAYYMKRAHEGKSRVSFPVPDGIKFAQVDARTGYKVNGQTQEKLRVAVKEEVIITDPPAFDESAGSWTPNDQQVTTAPIEEDGIPEF